MRITSFGILLWQERKHPIDELVPEIERTSDFQIYDSWGFWNCLHVANLHAWKFLVYVNLHYLGMINAIEIKNILASLSTQLRCIHTLFSQILIWWYQRFANYSLRMTLVCGFYCEWNTFELKWWQHWWSFRYSFETRITACQNFQISRFWRNDEFDRNIFRPMFDESFKQLDKSWMVTTESFSKRFSNVLET